jgi:hypothetical protein
MAGFSLAHGTGGILLLFPILLVLWTALAVVLKARSPVRGFISHGAPVDTIVRGTDE